MLTVVILTYNEEKHLARALESVRGLASQVLVVDSRSTDRTVEIARSCGAEVVEHGWEQSHARQLNWALEEGDIRGSWVMRLDADEYVTPELAEHLRSSLSGLAPDVCGLYVRRRVHFQGAWIRHGGMYPMWVLRVWRRGAAHCEARWMDEHMVLDVGRPEWVKADIVDENLNDLAWWTAKHVGYARREAADLALLMESTRQDAATESLHGQASRKRVLKNRFYSRAPRFLRSVGYFLYRFIFRSGWRDGVPGLVWHVLQGFWYRFLVDAHLYELDRARRPGENVAETVERLWGLTGSAEGP